jgi:hypothetical protein
MEPGEAAMLVLDKVIWIGSWMLEKVGDRT